MREPYWFPAKTRGWGWGLPVAWQGWFVLALFFVLVLVGALLLLPRYGQWIFLSYCAVLVVVLVAICWKTGAPPRWRRGQP